MKAAQTLRDMVSMMECTLATWERGRMSMSPAITSASASVHLRGHRRIPYCSPHLRVSQCPLSQSAMLQLGPLSPGWQDVPFIWPPGDGSYKSPSGFNGVPVPALLDSRSAIILAHLLALIQTFLPRGSLMVTTEVSGW